MAEFEYDEVILHIKRIEKATAEVLVKSHLTVEKTGHNTVAYAQNLAPVDTGNLRASIGVDFDDDGLGFEAGPTAEYGDTVEYGGRPHVIRPREKKALSWPDAEHPVKKVNHPGTAPQPYMRPGFDRATREFDTAIDAIVRDAF
ncbi:HK97 gp10 family phage protein [Sphaerisporangium album]|uniref:HK97 gp10 family phage protein n=1 Tax=Sphaerisporangium album TaxID=509200 RepID=A0A367FP19_9ACTN|nr:HK97 gp10 family phage protein [Sphaerisporangium album]RCG31984.1 HK97 gp10 family phage protein [Sphaerisporangium album]